MCPLSGSFKKRKRKSIIVTGMLLVVSVLILVFGLAATTRTQNITVGGYYPGVIVSARVEPKVTFLSHDTLYRHTLPFVGIHGFERSECFFRRAFVSVSRW